MTHDGRNEVVKINPIFIFLVLIGAVLLWFLLSFIFGFDIGKITNRIINDAKDTISEEDGGKEIEER